MPGPGEKAWTVLHCLTGEAQMPSPDIQGQTVMSLKYTPTFPASTPHTTGIFYTIQKLSLKTHEFAPSGHICDIPSLLV